VNLQLQWVTQAQFAGYYVALENGYYDEENLDVNIMPGGPDIAPPQVLAGGAADVMLNWMPSALAAREAGLPVVNIAQPFVRSGLHAELLGRYRHHRARRPCRARRWRTGSSATSTRSWLDEPAGHSGRWLGGTASRCCRRASTSIRSCSGRPTASRP
jgi:hypothetical protein